MVPVMSLWAPILLSAVLVFVASAVIHMVLPYHRSDFRKVPSEDAVMESLRRLGVPPGNYMFPHAGSPAGMKDPAFGPRDLARWREALPSARVVELDDAGHWPHEEAPDRVIAALRDFLS